MTINVTTPVTGGAITGFTAPTYTVVADVPPNAYSRQYAVTAIGGTQAGVDLTGSATRPWTVTVYRPQNIKLLNAVDGNNVLRQVPNNVYGVLVRKGLTPLAGQAARVGTIRTEYSVPAGSDLADVPNIKAMVSFSVGVQSQQSSGIADTLYSGIL